MTLLEEALKISVVKKSESNLSDEELDLLIAFVSGDIKAVPLALVLGFTGPKRAQKAHNWGACKLRHAIHVGLVSLQRR